MFAYELDNYLEWLRGGFLEASEPDENTANAIRELFHMMEALAPNYEDSERRELWITAPKGTIEDYRAYFEEDGTEEEVQQAYDLYEKEIYWYKLRISHFTDNRRNQDYYGIFLNGSYILAIDDANSKGSPVDACDLVEWLQERVSSAIEELREGTYNDRIRKELPYELRYGTIGRKDYWDIYPEERGQFQESVSRKARKAFLAYENLGVNSDPPCYCWKTMTVREFFEACAWGYKALQMPKRECWRFQDSEEEHQRYGGITPKEMYYMYADGRDEGMSLLPMDDAEVFAMWLNHEGPYKDHGGGHPYEIVPSWSLEHSLHLYVRKCEQGYYFEMTGTTMYRCPATIVFYNALKAGGFPVYLYGMGRVTARIREDDRIGIVPEIYSTGGWNDHFDEHVSDQVHLSDGDRAEQVVKKAEWMEIPEVRLIEDDRK